MNYRNIRQCRLGAQQTGQVTGCNCFLVLQPVTTLTQEWRPKVPTANPSRVLQSPCLGFSNWLPHSMVWGNGINCEHFRRHLKILHNCLIVCPFWLVFLINK